MLLLRPVFRTGGLFSAATLITQKTTDNKTQSPPINVDQVPVESEDKQKSWARVKKIFTVDEFGAISPELCTIYQTTFFTIFAGACYGGFIQSREAYLSFIERNQATSFVDHFEAKKKLQDHVTMNFAKGALRWGWRLALFSGLYVTFVTVMSAYRGKPSIFDYTVGGLVSGGIYQMNVGLRGVIVGGTLGAIVGLFAGSATLAIMKISGTSLDDVNQYRYELSQSRLRHLREAVDRSKETELIKALSKYDVNTRD